MDVASATDIAEEFNAKGIRAEVVSAKTDARVRAEKLRRFKAREIMVLVNVDLFGEGFDLPAIEVVMMARPTQSYALFIQQFGRALRILDGKLHAIIIDHVGNVERHGLPDAPREWSLDRRERRSSSSKPTDVIPVKACPECTAVYERVYKGCPFCGYVPVPAARSGPQFVDGDLTELCPETLAAMRGEIEHADRDKEEYRQELAGRYTPIIGQLANVKRFVAGQESREVLRSSIAQWAGIRYSTGEPESESYRRFYVKFGMDVMTAQTLKRPETEALNINIMNDIVKEMTR